MTLGRSNFTPEPSILALDIGAVRTGVAIAGTPHGIPAPLTVIKGKQALIHSVRQLITDYNAQAVIVGLPKGLEGQDTAQTIETRLIIEALHGALKLPIHPQEETLTSVKAESELKARNKPYSKEDIDMLSAVYILEDYLGAHKEISS